MPKHPAGERFSVELVAQAGEVPAVVRLRHFLRAALRAWGLRCTGVRQLPATPTASPGATSPPAAGAEATEPAGPA